MLTPHRFTNLGISLMSVAAHIIDCLLQRHSASLDELLHFARNSNSDINEEDISVAVSFLFLLGKADYCTDREAVVLVESSD